MFKVSTKGDYGIILMTSLAKAEDDYIPLNKVAKERGLPLRYLAHLAKKLKEAGLLESKEGKRGGYRLSQKPKRITVAQILEALEGPVALARCVAQPGSCAIEEICALKPKWRVFKKKIQEAVKDYTLQDLL